ncbi:hypothetical protein OF83DRAFT_556441 [Amylostereum chailletii]|nr:hypothetical protein OF83DRAFT_556441 [Amylostereum chailletii]
MSNDHTKPAEQPPPQPPPPPPPPPVQPYPGPPFSGPPYSFYYPQSEHGDPNVPNGLPPGAYMMPFPPPHPGLVYYPTPPQPAQGYPFPQQAPTSSVTRTKRKQVKMACTNCAGACKRCDEARPCERCVKYGLQETCVDGVRKERKKGIKRGPYKRKNKPGSSPEPPPLGGFQRNVEPQWSTEHPPPPPPPPVLSAPPGFIPPPEGYHPYYYGYPHPPPHPDGHEGAPGGQPPYPYYAVHGYAPMPMYPPGAYVALPGQVPPPVIAAPDPMEARNGAHPTAAAPAPATAPATTPAPAAVVSEPAATVEPSNGKKKRRTKTGDDGTTKHRKKAKRANGEPGEGAEPTGAGEGQGKAPTTNGIGAHPPPVIAAA